MTSHREFISKAFPEHSCYNLLLIVKSAFHFNFISFFRKQIPRFRIHISFVYFLKLFIYILRVNSDLCGRANKQNKILSKCINKIFINIAWHFFSQLLSETSFIWLMLFNYKTKQMSLCACVWRYNYAVVAISDQVN